jgi:hypothetical protein
MQHVLRLRIWVRWHRLGMSVSAQKGMVRTIEITGRVMDRGGDAPDDSVFDLKEARVNIYSPTDPMCDVGSVGRITVLEDVNGGPRKSDWGDEPFPKRVPVEAHVWISHDAVDGIGSQLADAENRNISSHLILEFGVYKVPSGSALKNDVSLQILDLTKDQTYPVLSIYCGSYERDTEWPRRVPQTDRSARSPRYEISMGLVEARGDFDFKNGTVKDLSATFCAYDQAIKGTKIEVHWEEYDRDDLTNDYPDLSDTGIFDARALDEHTPDASSCFLYLHLRYTRGDARAWLLPLILARPPDLQIVLQATLLTDKSTLWKKPEGTRGRVIDCCFRLIRPPPQS